MKAFFADQIFDGKKLIDNAVLIINEGKIVWVGAENEIPSEITLPTLRKHVSFIMPGLIDCHVHLALLNHTPVSPIDWALCSVEAMQHLRELRKAGVVACRDLGSNDSIIIGIAKAQRQGLLQDMPRVVAAGAALATTGGHGTNISIECDGADEFTKACRQVIKNGAEVIKVMMSGGVNSPGKEPGPPEVNEDEIIAAVREAHARGRKVAVHAHGNTAIRRSVNAGVDSIEHGVFNSEDLIEQMAAQGTALVPTLCAPYYAVQEGLRVEPDNPDHKRSQAIVAEHNHNTRLAFEKGVMVCMGTDAGCPFNPHDRAFYEAVLLHKTGIPALDVLRIATLNGAILLGLDKELGTLDAGKQASFLILDTSPVKDIEALCADKQIYIQGKKVE